MNASTGQNRGDDQGFGQETGRSPGYSHTQKAPLCYLLCGITLLCLYLAWISRPPETYVLLVAGLMPALIAPAIHSLTVRDEGEHLAIRFGPLPLFSRKVRYDHIVRAELGRTMLIDGWGIHYSLRGGWVWNLWGRDCVVLHLKDRVLRVGTDDGENLLHFVRRRIDQSI